MDRFVFKVSIILSAIGSFLISQLGGWDKELYALVSLMAVDYMLGLSLGWCGKSSKTKSGKLSSKAGVIGIIKKVAYLLCVFVGVVLDTVIGSSFIREGVIIAFCATEMISIIENLTSLGIPIPEVFKKALDILHSKDTDKDE